MDYAMPVHVQSSLDNVPDLPLQNTNSDAIGVLEGNVTTAGGAEDDDFDDEEEDAALFAQQTRGATTAGQAILQHVDDTERDEHEFAAMYDRGHETKL